MTTDPGDLVLDPTCGSGTTACVAEQWGRRWITCDTSRVSVALAKQRLMTSVFNYYELAHPKEGIASGFKYKTVPHVTLKSIANNPEIREGLTREQIDAAISKYADQETLYDQPETDKKKTRVTGPFTMEAVPAPAVKPLDEVTDAAGGQEADAAIARTGETRRQGDWRDELLRTGIRGKGGQRIEFSRVEALAGTRWLHADAETKEGKPQRVVVSFGPDHAPLEQRQVALAIEEAQQLVPKPKMIVFAAFQFDPEASKDIDETNWPGVTLLKAQMNADLLTEDLKKKRASNESFWLIGQPDVSLEEIGNKIAGLENLLTWGRSYGLRLHVIFQDLAAFERSYGKTALDTLLSETEIKQFLPGQRSPKTLELISKKLLGEQSIMSASMALPQNQEGVRENMSEAGCVLMTEDELRRTPYGILFVRRSRTILFESVAYAEIYPWRRQVGINPFYGKPYRKKTRLKV
ncbi:MAG: TraM recognition domain-containing protein [Beijerinckiaceae bacterium]|nr:TraM recognition domain-containing protein [Beijerinckiaceae bacterium]